ncbi:hypothetical protein [Pseudomonas turukhanskensis]|uniref:hypothetical protein n=1 Tax=Pseudomonas turukhanskensis TaxID=1806536 RepID=UPI0022F2E84F|nr:hypothetical protein [Pseudomonas turukhanskensis]
MTRSAHSKKDVEQALSYVEPHGWRVVEGGGHCWGKMYCPYNDRDCRCGEFCISSIWSTPKNPGNFAKAIRRVVSNCTTHLARKISQAE